MEEHDESLERRTLDKSRFRIDTTVSLSVVATTLGMVYAVFAWGNDVKMAQAVQGAAMQSMKAEHDRDRAETLQALRDINKKLDDLALRRP